MFLLAMEESLDYTQNITEFPTRKIPKIWEPNSIDELREIVTTANKEARPVYPISTGHNWGLGSKLPIQDSDLIVLRKLNEIVEVNEDLAYARVQPGVTQLQLAEHLAKNHPELILNVTGGSARSSILGNAVERGSGKNGQRANDIRELKVMLASGEEFSTGFGNMPSAGPSYYKFGLGPDITHLFTQSNYGIVTECTINLIPKDSFTLFLTYLDFDDLGEFLDVFSKLVRKGVVGHSLEVDSQNDPKIFELFDHEVNPKNWICWFVVYGEAGIRSAKNACIKNSLSSVCRQIKTYESTAENKEALPPVKVRMSRYNGIPTDHSLISTAQAFGVDLDSDNPDIDFYKALPGFRCILPVIPFSRKGADIIDFIHHLSSRLGLAPVLSIICLDDYALEVFVRVHFDRENETQISAADRWAKTLLVELKKEGIFPYRLDVENMNFYLSNANDPFSNLKNEIKKFLDPQGVISSGRYQLINYK